jgi:hypothetical protein
LVISGSVPLSGAIFSSFEPAAIATRGIGVTGGGIVSCGGNVWGEDNGGSTAVATAPGGRTAGSGIVVSGGGNAWREYEDATGVAFSSGAMAMTEGKIGGNAWGE